MTDKDKPSPDIGLRVGTANLEGELAIVASFYEEASDYESPKYELGSAKKDSPQALDQMACDLIDRAIEKGQVLPEARQKLIDQFRSGLLMLLEV